MKLDSPCLFIVGKKSDDSTNKNYSEETERKNSRSDTRNERNYRGRTRQYSNAKIKNIVYNMDYQICFNRSFDISTEIGLYFFDKTVSQCS